MQIVWKETSHILGVSGFAAVGSLELYVVPLARAGRWVVAVDDASTRKELACDDAFMGTFDEAKARAVALGLGTLSPWVEIARAEGAAQEREWVLAASARLIAREQIAYSDADRIAVIGELVAAIRERKDGAP